MADAGLLGTLTFAVGAGLATFFAPCAYPPPAGLRRLRHPG